MRNAIIFIITLFILNTLQAQNLENHHIKTGNRTLFSFALLNMATSGAMLAANVNHADFHTTNIAWNSVNALIGGLAIVSERKFSSKSTYDKQKYLLDAEKAYLFNTALDATYIVAGLWIRNVNIDGANSKAVGNALVYNGAFLLLYDAVMTHVSVKRNKAWLHPLLGSNYGNVQVGLSLHF
jgi:hypothetical protein